MIEAPLSRAELATTLIENRQRLFALILKATAKEHGAGPATA